MSSLLQQQMTRYYEHMRPRLANPTYSSFNVSSSIVMSASPPVTSTPKISRHRSKQKENNNIEQQKDNKRPNSQLSHYGTTSLSFANKKINERDVYEKQERRYNIITIQPKKHRQTIKKYPKLRLENTDQNYYKRMELQSENRNNNY